MNPPVFFQSSPYDHACLVARQSVKITYQTLIAAFRHLNSLLVVLMITSHLTRLSLLGCCTSFPVTLA